MNFELIFLLLGAACLVDIILNLAAIKRVDDLERKLGVYSEASKTLAQIVHEIHKQQHAERFLTVEQRKMINKPKGDKNVRQN